MTAWPRLLKPVTSGRRQPRKGSRRPVADLTPEAMAAKLMATPFERSSASVARLSDPIADTPMVVTLDELRPYDRNPRLARNPLYDAIKDSIRTRGLDSPPQVTRRPGEKHYIIRNGGNTRLAILRELWAETKDEKFFRLKCLFRPWSPRGEIVALTGHLAENELHGELTFIERALAVDKARELYEEELGAPLSQRELARRLTADGYPISQSHISRMQEAVTYLLPAIPSLLYAGLGRGLAERLTALRRNAADAWARDAKRVPPGMDFTELFHEVLAHFDESPATFAIERVRDELIGEMAQALKSDYDTIALEVADSETRQRILTGDSAAIAELGWPDKRGAPATRPQRATSPVADTPPAAPSHVPPAAAPDPRERSVLRTRTDPDEPDGDFSEPDPETSVSERLQGHIVSPAETSPRLEAIQRTIAEATGEVLERFEDNVVRAIPVQAGGLYPISDVWYIEAAIDTPGRLRVHIDQLAREIAAEAGLAHRIESTDEGIGFLCTAPEPGAKAPTPLFLARAILSLLNALSTGYQARRSAVDGIRLIDDLAPLLQGALPGKQSPQNTVRLSDAGLVKLFRLLRLARRLIELEMSAERSGEPPPNRPTPSPSAP